VSDGGRRLLLLHGRSGKCASRNTCSDGERDDVNAAVRERVHRNLTLGPQPFHSSSLRVSDGRETLADGES